jgi:hypothetical protein
MKTDYSVFFKTSYDDGNIDSENYDYFFSGYDNCPRTTTIYNKVVANQKLWFLFPQYNIKQTDLPAGEEFYTRDLLKEDDFFIDYITGNNLNFGGKICVDTTGFLHPHLIFLIKYLYLKGVKRIDFLYTEPKYYKKAEDTKFSGFIDDVRIIEGYGASYTIPNVDNDLLITAAGYDDKLIAKISQAKSKIRSKYAIIGFPSLQPDMYQESILKIHSAKESIGVMKQKFAPAYDPFITAQVIDNIINENVGCTNIYLSPLSTKPQTLGMAFYYLWNHASRPISIIYPFSKSYPPSTGVGIKKTWKYTFELP